MMDTVSLDHLLDTYRREKRPAEATVKCYEKALQALEAGTPVTRHCDIRQIPRDAVLTWRNDILDRCTPNTWLFHERHLKSLIRFGIKHRLLEEQDNVFATLERTKVPKKRKKTVDHDVIRAVATVNIEPLWFWVLVTKMFFYTGMRRKQLITIEWRDVNFNDNTLLLRDVGAKTGCDNLIPIPPQIIRDLKELRYKMKKTLYRELKPEDQVFNVTLFHHRYLSRRMTPNHVTDAYKRISRQLGSPISAHRLRHTCATWHIEVKKTSPVTVQELLGHAKVTTTLDFYVHSDVNKIRSAISDMPELL